jgi:phosphoribosylformimino-5-aminoimidazole carboxamide ribotide isomerase
MIIIPAVDIKDGNCVRLEQGRANHETVYSDSPVTMAKKWQSEGAERLHVVDLDGAFAGDMKNIETVLEIAAELDIPVDVGGGIRNYDTVKRLIEGGIYRVILGTSAIDDRELLETVVGKWPEKITVGIDSIGGKVATGGWLDVTEELPSALAVKMSEIGVTEIIATDIKTDGMLKGPNLDLMREIASAVDIQVIASGGVSSIHDIKKLKKLKLPNLSGVIVGKALYSGDLDLKEAIAITKGD